MTTKRESRDEANVDIRISYFAQGLMWVLRWQAESLSGPTSTSPTIVNIAAGRRHQSARNGQRKRGDIL